MLSAPKEPAAPFFCGFFGGMPDGSYHYEMQLLIEPFFMGLWSVHFFESGCLDI